MTPEQRAQLAYMMGALAALHAETKRLEEDGVPDLDMVACGLEDVYCMMLPLVDDISQAEAMSINS